jgi:hypothetical protein
VDVVAQRFANPVLDRFIHVAPWLGAELDDGEGVARL